MRYRFALVFVLLALSHSLIAQNARVRRYTTPKSGTTSPADTFRKDKPHTRQAAPLPDGQADQQKLSKIKKQVSKKYPHRVHKKKQLEAPNPSSQK